MQSFESGVEFLCFFPGLCVGESVGVGVSRGCV